MSRTKPEPPPDGADRVDGAGGPGRVGPAGRVGAADGQPVTEVAAGLPGRAREAARTLNPGYFALVMATGIISVTMSRHGLPGLSLALLWLTAACYVALVPLYAWRVLCYRREVGADLRDPGRSFGFFTFVAGTDVLGTRLAMDGRALAAFGLLAAGCLGWLLAGYVIPWMATLGGSRRPVIADVNGTWFIWAVAAQSVAVLSAILEPTVHTGRAALAFLAVFCWSVGIFLYGAAAIFVAARLLHYGLSPGDVTPPYWVSMGATAITVVAGTRIVEMASAPAVDATRHLVAGASVLFWAFGTWLFPALVAAGLWRHLAHRVPLRYEAALWAIIFPLGMYSVAGYSLDADDHLPIARVIGEVEGWFALAAWAVTFAAMLYHLYRTLWREPAGLVALEPDGGS